MEMCYDGALVMPSSYAVMSEDEMSYIEGGLTWSQTKKLAVSFLAVIGGINTIVTAFSNAVKFGKFIRGIAQGAFVKGIATKVSAAIGRIVTWISAHAGVVAGIAGALIGFGGGYYLGKTVASKVYSRYHR